MNPAPNLVLVGPMGAGKSSLGRQLARRLGLAFVDADARLEDQAGASVATIFELEGEAGFRAREERLLCELLQTDGQLIASGGGAVLSPATRAAMQARAFVVWQRAGVVTGQSGELLFGVHPQPHHEGARLHRRAGRR